MSTLILLLMRLKSFHMYIDICISFFMNVQSYFMPVFLLGYLQFSC